MAKKKTRVNKNVVGFLTVMGMVLTVSVVGLIIWRGAQRDPETLAQNARVLEQAGAFDDLQKAAALYQQAYVASGQEDPRYLLDTARCLFKVGNLSDWLGLLTRANSEHPADPVYPRAVLAGLWRLYDIEGRVRWAGQWRDFSEKLLALEPENAMALASEAAGAWARGTPEDESRAAEAAQQAYELEPHHPRVVEVYLTWLRQDAGRDIEALREAGALQSEIQQRDELFIDRVLAVLREARSAHPEDPTLAMRMASYLERRAQQLRGQGDADGADELLHQGGEVLRAALDDVAGEFAAVQAQLDAAEPGQDLPDLWERRVVLAQYLPELHYALAQNLRQQLVERLAERGTDEFRALQNEIREHAARAAELDPAMFEAHALKANLHLAEAGSDFVTADDYRAAIAEFEESASSTVTLRNVRAVLNEGERFQMMRQAFTAALAFHEFAERENDAELQDEALERAQLFLDDIQTRWPENAITNYLTGLEANFVGDRGGAIIAFERAFNKEERAGWWARAARVNRLPTEYLAELYLEAGQLGEAERFAELALEQYTRDLNVDPSARLIVTQVDILTRLGRDREALELLDRFQPSYPDNQQLVAARVAVLTRLGRTADAQAVQQQFTGEGMGSVLWKARIAVEQEDYTAAEPLLQSVLESGSIPPRLFNTALRLYVRTMGPARSPGRGPGLSRAAPAAGTQRVQDAGPHFHCLVVRRRS
jgi:hypothetical protein